MLCKPRLGDALVRSGQPCLDDHLLELVTVEPRQARDLHEHRGIGTLSLHTETWTFLRRGSGHGDAMRWFDRVLGARNLQRVDEYLETEAWAWLRIHDEREYSFVDATSFALMRRKRIADALAFDGDFAAAGFNELRP